MIKAYRYKIKPTKAQEAFLKKCFGCCRFVYNYALNKRIEAYSSEKKTLTFFDQCTALRKMKKQPKYAWLNEVPALSMNYALLNLNNAYGHFFKTKSGFPKYKSKKDGHDSVKFEPNSTKYDFKSNKVRIPKLGWVRIYKDKFFDQSSVKINATTVSRDKCGTYWCSVSVDDGIPLPPKAKVTKATAIGLDMGLSEFATLSTGEKIPNMRFSEEKAIAKAQKCLARKVGYKKEETPSKRFLLYKTKLAKKHRRIANRRTDFLHKLSTDLVRKYDTICVEDLNVNGMMKNHNLARAISSVAWSEFFRMITYKCDWYGKNLLKSGRFDATSQVCSRCGYRNANTKDLSVRRWTCPECGTHHDRDVNAAINIMKMAIERDSPSVKGITGADGADSENNNGTSSHICNYASDETPMKLSF
jgi:putative transposase